MEILLQCMQHLQMEQLQKKTSVLIHVYQMFLLTLMLRLNVLMILLSMFLSIIMVTEKDIFIINSIQIMLMILQTIQHQKAQMMFMQMVQEKD